MADLREMVHENIRKSGLSVIAVQPDPEKGVPNFSYSIGLSLLQKHELFSESFPPDLAQYLINEIAKQLPKHNIGIDHSCIIKGLVQNDMPIALIEVDDERVPRERTIQVPEMIDVKSYSVLQIILPDPAGIFPWEEGHDDSMGVQTIYRNDNSNNALARLMKSAPVHIIHHEETKH